MTVTETRREFDQRINHAPTGIDPRRDLPPGFIDFLEPLHREFTPRQQKLEAKRAEVLKSSHEGTLPTFLKNHAKAKGDWRIELPRFVEDQRNQMTGPADDAELVVKMLNSGAPGVMLDLEDSMANNWENLEQGIKNALDALHGDLTYYDKKRDREVSIGPSWTVIWTRVRGLHLNQAGVVPNELMSASVYDVARMAFGVNPSRLKHHPCFYIPKSEAAEEAVFWRDLFQAIESRLGWNKGTIKCMALVESHPMAYQMEEFLYELRDHILGLNLGRWDYMASLIHFNIEDPNWVLPDRNTIPSDVAFFQNLRELMVNVCHRHGMLAIGGMTALFPSRVDPEVNERALQVLEADKKNESSLGMDGAWTGHPDQNAIAVAQFPQPNQGFVEFVGRDGKPDLRPIPSGIGKHTLDGTHAAVKTVIRYRQGVLSGKGASLLDGYMEDLATDRIYRLMISQRVKHRESVEIVDDRDNPIRHTPELITKLFDEELERIIRDLPEDRTAERETYREARRVGEEMIVNEWHDPI